MVERDGPVTTVRLSRPHARNAVDGETASALADAFRAFDADPTPTPSASRRFRRTDRIVIDVPYETIGGEPEFRAQLTNRDGKVLASLPLAKGPDGVARVVMPLASLAPSTYTVRVEVKAGDEQGAQVVAFTVSQ